MGTGAAGVMEEHTTACDLVEGIRWSWGRQSEFESTPPGEFSFTLDNADGKYTPDNAASSLTTKITEGMEVCFQLGVRLTLGTIRTLEPAFPDGQSGWAKVRVTCDDMLGNMGRRDFTALADGISEAAQQQLMWKFDDAVGVAAAVETNGNSAMQRIPGTRALVASA
jgi:hypothetical protein